MYKKLKNYVNKVVKKCKFDYYTNLINKNKGSSGELWKTLNDISSRKSHFSPSCIVADGISYFSPKSIAEKLNDHFSSTGSELAYKIKHKSQPSNLEPKTNSSSNFSENEFVFQPVKQNYAYDILSKLKTKKATGLDKISARLLKDTAIVIAPVLTNLFNRSLQSSIFPSIWKSRKVTSIFKSGDQSNANNYRPITILPTISKVFEKVVHSQVHDYLSNNKILTARQLGFRPKLSTEIALVHFTDTILNNMDKGLVTGAVFLDLSKAFDTVDHSILLEKLKSCNFSIESVRWFKSYLTNRNQVIVVSNAVSSSKQVSVGVPQGSVLGPLLFLIYVNNLPLSPIHCEISLYADDTVIYYSSDNAHDIENRINSDLERLCKWFDNNLLRRIKHLLPFLYYNSLVLPLFDYSDIIWRGKNNCL